MLLKTENRHLIDKVNTLELIKLYLTKKYL
jgi:hypothetical protein